MDDKEFADTLDRIDAQLVAPRTAKFTEMDGSALCAQYRSIRPLLQAILPFIQKIPVWGGKLATAVTFLMTLADTVCPA